MASALGRIRLGVCLAALFYLSCSFAQASQVGGQIILQKMPRKHLLAPAVYDLRGMAMPDHPPSQEPGNEFEQVAVWLESGPPAPPITAALEQRNRHFYPELLVIPVGST